MFLINFLKPTLRHKEIFFMELIAMLIFLGACFWEYKYSEKHDLKVYKKDQILSHLSNGFGQIALNSLSMIYLIKIYNWLVENYSLFKLPSTSIFSFLLVIIVSDLIYYLAHRLSHRVNLFIAIHNVHHQAQDYNLLSAFRLPWLNRFVLFVFFAPLAILGATPAMIMIALSINSLVATLAHSGVFRRKIFILSDIFITPPTHLVHHGINPIYRDKNFGGIFIIWDKLFGTFQDLKDSEPVKLPSNNDEVHQSPLVANTIYFKKILLGIQEKKGFLAKLAVLFGAPENLIIPKVSVLRDSSQEKTNLNHRFLVVFFIMVLIQIQLILIDASITIKMLLLISSFILIVKLPGKSRPIKSSPKRFIPGFW